MSAAEPPTTIVPWIAAVVAGRSSHVAVVADGREWTYREVWARSGAVARHLLHERRLKLGDRVALVGANEPAYLTTYLGILRAGCVAVPLNAMLDEPAMCEQLALVGASATIVGEIDDDTYEGLADAGVVWAMRDLPRSGSGYLPQVARSTPACILLTSGSTGRPKGVVHSHGTLLHAALQLATAFPLAGDDRSVAFLPFYASIPEQVLPVLCSGASVDVLQGFDVERVARACRTATTFDAVPTVMARLLDGAPRDDLRGLRWVMFASEPMPATVLHRWWDAFPGVETHQFYGMTELLPLTYAPDRMLREEPTTVGAPFATSRLYAVDEAGGEIGDGTAGELVCHSPARMSGYYEDQLATEASRAPDGAVRTGDLGRLDERGRVFLTGRLKDLIISGGINIAPAEIEAVACRHHAVVAAAVVGIPDQRWGETPVVVAVPANGHELDARELLQYCRNELTSFKRPSGAALIDALPATGIGKSAKAVIRQRILDGEIRLVRAD